MGGIHRKSCKNEHKAKSILFNEFTYYAHGCDSILSACTYIQPITQLDFKFQWGLVSRLTETNDWAIKCIQLWIQQNFPENFLESLDNEWIRVEDPARRSSSSASVHQTKRQHREVLFENGKF